MKKFLLFSLTLIAIILLSGCSQKITQPKTSTTQYIHKDKKWSFQKTNDWEWNYFENYRWGNPNPDDYARLMTVGKNDDYSGANDYIASMVVVASINDVMDRNSDPYWSFWGGTKDCSGFLKKIERHRDELNAQESSNNHPPYIINIEEKRGDTPYRLVTEGGDWLDYYYLFEKDDYCTIFSIEFNRFGNDGLKENKQVFSEYKDKIEQVIHSFKWLK